MKMIIVVALAIVAIAVAVPVEPNQSNVDEIIENIYELQLDGSYKSRSKTSNGIERNEEGISKQTTDEDGKPKTIINVAGSYAYTDEDGVPHVVEYYADENGYHPKGNDVPTLPSVASRR